jgi:hypothetical protein
VAQNIKLTTAHPRNSTASHGTNEWSGMRSLYCGTPHLGDTHDISVF